jgi:hypothetical protein
MTQTSQATMPQKFGNVKRIKASYLETAHWLSTYTRVNLSDGWAILSKYLQSPSKPIYRKYFEGSLCCQTPANWPL